MLSDWVPAFYEFIVVQKLIFLAVYRPAIVHRLQRVENMLKLPDFDRVECERELRKADETSVWAKRIWHREGSVKLDASLQPVCKGKAAESPAAFRSFFLKDAEEEKKAEVCLSMVFHFCDFKTLLQTTRNWKPKKPKWTGKSIWKGRDGEEVSVEEIARQDYEDQGFKGYVPIPQ